MEPTNLVCSRCGTPLEIDRDALDCTPLGDPLVVVHGCAVCAESIWQNGWNTAYYAMSRQQREAKAQAKEAAAHFTQKETAQA
jgi:hypothetical protein